MYGLPGAEDLFYNPKKRRKFLDYLLVYNSWKNHLPPKQKRNVPRIRCMLVGLPTQIYRLTYLSPMVRCSLPAEERTLENEFITHVFFPFRFVDYNADSQLTEEHPDNMPISEETPADRAKLDSLIRFLKDRGGVLERDMLTFMYMKQLHPSIDWRNVIGFLN